MLDISQIKKLFRALNKELSQLKVKGEIGICGGTVMCLVFQTRKATKDVDGIFEPTREIRQASLKVAKAMGVSKDWLNDAAKAFFHVDPPREEVMELSHLRIWAPRADYMLAMKCISARFDSYDREDVEFLLKYLHLKNPGDVFSIIEKYYPRFQISPKTQFLIEELLG